jgi:uncharacterized protein with von Willebrand factor type A (vWA) domain
MAHLRLNGLPAGLPEAETALRALERIAPTDPGEVRLALKAICANGRRPAGALRRTVRRLLAGRRTGAAAAGARPRTAAGRRRGRPRTWRRRRHPPTVAARRTRRTTSGDGEADMSGEGRLVASRLANLRKTDLRALATPEELAAAETIAYRLARAMHDRRSRRRKAARRGAQLDLRRIARHSVARGGEPLDPAAEAPAGAGRCISSRCWTCRAR